MANIVERIDEAYGNGMEYAEKFMLEARAECIEKGEEGLSDLISVCNELGALYREQSRFHESIENFTMAYEGLVAVCGTNAVTECAVILLNVAGVYRLMREFEEAAKRYQTALDIMDMMMVGDTYERASLYNNMSLTYLAMDEIDSAFNYATAGYEIMARLHPGESEEAISLSNLASLALRKGDLEMAQRHAGKALDIYETRKNTSGHYPAILNMNAVIAFRKGEYDKALEGFEKSAEFTRKNFGENIDYAAAIANIGSVYKALGDDAKAQECLAQAAEIKSRLQ